MPTEPPDRDPAQAHLDDPAWQFLNALYSSAPDDLWWLMWVHPGKRSVWNRPTAGGIYQAWDHAQDASRNRNVYVGAALSREDRGTKRRVANHDAAGILALWSDIDIASDAHAKSNLPPDQHTAAALIADAGLPEPSILVHSGHGLQAWWLLDEPWIFTGHTDRDRATKLAHAWNAALKRTAGQQGWTVDSVYDLSRVLRLPGTVNHKMAADPKPVTLIDLTADRRYDPATLEKHCGADRIVSLSSSSYGHRHIGPFQLDAHATPDHERLDAMFDAEPRMRSAWSRTRSLTEQPDQSASSYDLALANYAVAAGWTDQEIVDLLIASRRKHGDDLKLRQDYYARTIAKARDQAFDASADEQLEQVREELGEARDAGDNDAVEIAGREALEVISRILKFPIVAVAAVASTPVSYRVETSHGAVALASTAELTSQSKFRQAVFEATGGRHWPPQQKPAQWNQIVQALGEALVWEEADEEATDEGQARVYVEEHLRDTPPTTDREEAFEHRVPLYVPSDGSSEALGEVWVYSRTLRTWVHAAYGDRVTPHRFGALMRALGGQRRNLNLGDGRQQTRWTVSTQRLPGFVPPSGGS